MNSLLAQLLYINWNPDIYLINLGSFGFRWYSTCWLVGLALAYFLVRKLFIDQNIETRTVMLNGKKTVENNVEPLFIYCFLGILIGARLGHCLFYQPDYFLSSGTRFLEMFLPIHFKPEGGFVFTGFEGLASHGGTLGLMIALYLYVRKTKIGLLTVLDNIAIATPVTACFIRLGNLMNSEIIGKVTTVPWAFIFERIDPQPRHPGQLYEAIAYALLFVVGWYIYRKHAERVGTGYFFGLCLTYIFTARFFIEFTKDVQEPWEANMPLNMGQLLSIPFVALGIWCMWRSKKPQQ